MTSRLVCNALLGTPFSGKSRQWRECGRKDRPQRLKLGLKIKSLNCRAAKVEQEEDLTASVAKRALDIIVEDSSVDPYYMGWNEAQSNGYDVKHAPEGCIQLGLAENNLSLDLLDRWFATHDTAPPPELEKILNFKAISGYPDVYHGLFVFRELVANFMNKLFGGGVTFDPEKMVITTGATPAIEMLGFCLADPGDVFLVPAPYYPGFDRDITLRSQVNLLPVPSFSENNFGITKCALEQAFTDSERKGSKVKAVLMTSPSNPVGGTYHEDQLLLILQFVMDKNIHLICDEIYAGSVFGTLKFTSVAELVMAPGMNPTRVHIIYGLSKILGIPGFRVGLLYSWNSHVLDATKRFTRFSSVPTLTQQIFVSLLSDEEFLHFYIDENKNRLRQRWELVSSGLHEAGIEFENCTAGFFCWVNMGRALAVGNKDQELELWRTLLYDVRINITPGSACHSPEHGWFRLCFALVDDQTIVVALDRLKQFMQSIQRTTPIN